jgi:hypothetical protein
MEILAIDEDVEEKEPHKSTKLILSHLEKILKLDLLLAGLLPSDFFLRLVCKTLVSICPRKAFNLGLNHLLKVTLSGQLICSLCDLGLPFTLRDRQDKDPGLIIN